MLDVIIQYHDIPSYLLLEPRHRLTSILQKVTSISFSMVIEKNENRWFRLQSSSYVKDE
jgi:hypothetical protein